MNLFWSKWNLVIALFASTFLSPASSPLRKNKSIQSLNLSLETLLGYQKEIRGMLLALPETPKFKNFSIGLNIIITKKQESGQEWRRLCFMQNLGIQALKNTLLGSEKTEPLLSDDIFESKSFVLKDLFEEQVKSLVIELIILTAILKQSLSQQSYNICIGHLAAFAAYLHGFLIYTKTPGIMVLEPITAKELLNRDRLREDETIGLDLGLMLERVFHSFLPVGTLHEKIENKIVETEESKNMLRKMLGKRDPEEVIFAEELINFVDYIPPEATSSYFLFKDLLLNLIHYRSPYAMNEILIDWALTTEPILP